VFVLQTTTTNFCQKRSEHECEEVEEENSLYLQLMERKATNSMELGHYSETNICSVAQKCQAFIEPEVLLQWSQEPATGPSPEPHESTQYPPFLLHFNIILSRMP
jgi:hypothetical protein